MRALLLSAAVLAGCASPTRDTAPDAATVAATPSEVGGLDEQHAPEPATSPTSLGAFSVSLNVADLAASLAFYEALGFEIAGGVREQNWLILRNGSVTIGLFQGMFERNMLTFNPGWNARAEPVSSFTDVRDLQARFEAAGLVFAARAEPGTDGPASLVLVDPDGNPVLIDQHVPKAH